MLNPRPIFDAFSSSRSALSMRPSAALPLDRTARHHPLLDGEDLPTTETTPETTLENSQITKMLSASEYPCQRPPLLILYFPL